MKASEIEIPEPCGEDFESMSEQGARRFCESCSCHVHDFSKMTRDEAESLLAESGDEPICVRFEARGDEIVFAPSRLERQRRGARRMLAAAAFFAAPLAACSPEAPAPPSAAVSIEPAAVEDSKELERVEGLFRGATIATSSVEDSDRANRERTEREAAERAARLEEQAQRKPEQIKCGTRERTEPAPATIEDPHANCIEVSGPSGTRVVHNHGDSDAREIEPRLEKPTVPHIRTMGRWAAPKDF